MVREQHLRPSLLAWLALWSVALATPLRAQEAAQATSFLPAPRTLRQHLVRANKAIEDGQFGDAVAELGALLAEEQDAADFRADLSQDFFVAPFVRATARVSLKGEARRLLGSMPEAARELYELQFGAEAKALLAEAAASGDVASLTEVTRKYFHTQAGYEATLLLGRLQLDRGHPLAAAMCFERLSQFPAATARFEPELSMLLAACWLYADHPERARDALEQLRTRFPKLTITIRGKEVNGLPEPADAQDWLATQLGNRFAGDAKAASQWVVFRGDTSRNAASAGGSPLPTFRWRSASDDPTGEALIEELQSDRLERRDPLLPSVHALAVQNVVLMRTPQRLQALDFDTGKFVWEYPWWDAAAEDVSTDNVANRGTDQLQARRDRLTQRLWKDAPYGQVSSDGKSVFMLDDLRPAIGGSPAFNPRPGGMRVPNPNQPSKHNQLVALDLRREGSLRWMVGSETGLDEPKLAGAFFLGPPLPVSGMLFVMAEVNGEIRLLALDPETGQQEWSQQLAHVDFLTIDKAPQRRLAGASPSYADGVLLCPTSAGAVIAVEVATRSLLWGYQYKPPPQPRGFGFARSFPQTSVSSTGTWQDASVTIDNGLALVAPIDANQIFCLDLQFPEGKPRWSRPRDKEIAEAVYVACIHDGKAIIVNKHSVAAISMENDGGAVWEKPIELDRNAGEMPSGRGFRSGSEYYLPTTRSRLLKIDLDKGTIAASLQTESPLGNLICYQDQLVSHSAGSVACFYQIEPLRERVAERLKDSPDDPWALARQGELFLHDGDNTKALASLRRAFEVDPEDDSVQSLLVETYLTALRQDFASHQAMAGEIEALIDLPDQKTEYLQLIASGYHQTGKLLEALEAYAKLVDVQQAGQSGDEATRAFLVKVEQDRSVRLDRWVRARLHELADSDDPAVAARLEELIQARATSTAERTATQLERDVACFGFHEASRPLLFSLCDRLVDSKRFLTAEQLLQPLRDHPDLPTSGAATARLAKLYLAATEYELAATLFRELGGRFADVACATGKSGQQLFEEAQSHAFLETEFQRSRDWPWGKVTSSEQNAQTNQSLARLISIPVEHTGINARGAITVGFNRRFNTLTVRDKSGRELLKSTVERPQANGQDRAQFLGHQGFIFFGSDLIAVDTLASSLGKSQPVEPVRWRQNIAPPVGDWKPEPARSVPFDAQAVRVRRNFDVNSGRAICSMGPVNEQGVFYQRLKKLVCADPSTGEPIWSRTDLPAGATIFGDREYLFVVADDTDQAIVLRASDGTKLGERQLPAAANRWTFHGRHVLAWEEQGERYRVYLRDIWSETDIWAEEVGPLTAGKVTMDGNIAMLQRNGRFFLRSLSTDQVLIRRRLEADPQLTNLRVIRSGDRYLVFAGTVLPENDARELQSPHIENAPLVTARLYAFDAATGQISWQVPAVIDRFGFPRWQPTDSPAIWFIRQVNVKQTLGSSNRQQSGLLCLDRRTGRIIYEKDNIPIQPNEFNITTDSSRRTSTVNLQSQAHTVQFTDEPTPPAPPAQTGAASSLTLLDNRLTDVAGSVFKALERQTPGADPFGADPFGDPE